MLVPLHLIIHVIIYNNRIGTCVTYFTDSDITKKCWYWPDTDTDARIGAALYVHIHALYTYVLSSSSQHTYCTHARVSILYIVHSPERSSRVLPPTVLLRSPYHRK